MTPTRAGATATWQASLTAGDWEVFVKYATVDGELNVRSLDRGAQYEVFRGGGSTVVGLDQNSKATEWHSLGTYTFDSGPASVKLTFLAEATDGNTDPFFAEEAQQ